MPHLRNRYIENSIRQYMSFSGIVGLLGHRQVGKTTVLSKLCKKYHTLDLSHERDEASTNPSVYLKKRAGTWVGIDECQTVPELFPELKEWVRTHKKPGQFLLSGSTRFSSKESIKESLTGRIMNLELFPLTVSELNHDPLSDFCPKMMTTKNLENFARSRNKSSTKRRSALKDIELYYGHGGLPGVCFIRNEKMRIQKINAQLETLLDRDLRLVKKIQLTFGEIKAILHSLSLQQGIPLDYTRTKKETGVSTPSIKKVISALEALFIIRIIPIEGSTVSKTVYFEDQAEYATTLSQDRNLIDKMNHFLFTQIRTQFEYQLGELTQCFQYRTRGGALIPLAYKNPSGVLGLISVQSPENYKDVLGSINSFLKTYADSKVIVIHPEQKPPEVIRPRVLLASIADVV